MNSEASNSARIVCRVTLVFFFSSSSFFFSGGFDLAGSRKELAWERFTRGYITNSIRICSGFVLGV